jgi:NADPH2:quinone reductase
VLVGFSELGARVRNSTRARVPTWCMTAPARTPLFASLDSLRPRGLMVSFGNSSGPVAPFAPLELARRGSLYFTRAGGGDYLADHQARQTGSRELFRLMKQKKIRVHIGQRYPLAEAAQRARRPRGTTHQWLYGTAAIEPGSQ